MINVNPYLIFDGNCKEAMNFYQAHLGGDIRSLTYAEAQGKECPPGSENLIIHSCLMKGQFNLMASDMPYGKTKVGDNVQLYLTCDNNAEVDRLYKALTEGGNGQQPPQETFWGSYFAMTTDKYGINWMLSFEQGNK